MRAGRAINFFGKLALEFGNFAKRVTSDIPEIIAIEVAGQAISSLLILVGGAVELFEEKQATELLRNQAYKSKVFYEYIVDYNEKLAYSEIAAEKKSPKKNIRHKNN